MITDPHADHAAKASIREVYAIVSQLESKLVEELHRVEARLTEAIEYRDEKHAEEIVHLRMDVDDLKHWRDDVQHSKAVQAAMNEGRLQPVRTVVYWLEEHWRLVTVILAVILTLILFVADLDVHLNPNNMPF